MDIPNASPEKFRKQEPTKPVQCTSFITYPWNITHLQLLGTRFTSRGKENPFYFYANISGLL